MRVLGRFSEPFLLAGLESLLGASVGFAIARVSSLGGFEALDDECLRWCVRAAEWFVEPATRA